MYFNGKNFVYSLSSLVPSVCSGAAGFMARTALVNLLALNPSPYISLCSVNIIHCSSTPNSVSLLNMVDWTGWVDDENVLFVQCL